MTLHRRAFLGGAAVTPFALNLVGPSALADMPGTQVMGMQHLKAGEGVVTALLDGFLPVSYDLLNNLSEEEAKAYLEAAFRKPGPVTIGINAYLWRTPEHTMLIDAGGRGAFPGTGSMFDALAAAGVTEDEIDTVLVTHLHPDHIGGMLTDGAPTFANAVVHVHEADIGFWGSEEVKAQAPADFHPFFDLAAGVLAAYGERVMPFNAEDDVAPGVTAMPLPGHTPGHSGFLLGGADPLLVWGDVVHVGVFQFPKPEVTIGFDTDQDLAAATRAKVFDMAATDRVRVAGMHLAFPGVGHVVKASEGYDYEPEAWSFTLD